MHKIVEFKKIEHFRIKNAFIYNIRSIIQKNKRAASYSSLILNIHPILHIPADY